MPATLQSRLPAITAQLRPKVEAAVKQGAEIVSREAQTRVPVGAPQVHLKDHFHVNRTGPAEYEVAAGEGETFYAHLVEFGTSHSAPRPFLVPALEDRRNEVVSLVRDALKDL